MVLESFVISSIQVFIFLCFFACGESRVPAPWGVQVNARGVCGTYCRWVLQRVRRFLVARFKFIPATYHTKRVAIPALKGSPAGADSKWCLMPVPAQVEFQKQEAAAAAAAALTNATSERLDLTGYAVRCASCGDYVLHRFLS